MSEQPERTEHGGPVVSNDAWAMKRAGAPRRCTRFHRRHRVIPHSRYPTYDVCFRCGAVWPHPIPGLYR